MNQWFVIQNGRVLGPYSEAEVKSQVADGQFTSDLHIWGRTQSEWKSISWWIKEAPKVSSIAPKPEIEKMWHYAVDGDSRGPFNRIELINELKNLRGTDILLWTKGMKSWLDLYEFHDILDELGLNRRKHSRVKINGSVTLTYADTTSIGVLNTISAGGFGATQLNAKFSIGQTLSIEIRSNQLSQTVSAKANVQYISDSGFYGFKFSNVSMEAKALIMDYIKGQKAQTLQAA